MATPRAGNECGVQRAAMARLGHFNRRSLELMQRHNGNGIIFDGTITDCEVCAVGKG